MKPWEEIETTNMQYGCKRSELKRMEGARRRRQGVRTWSCVENGCTYIIKLAAVQVTTLRVSGSRANAISAGESRCIRQLNT